MLKHEIELAISVAPGPNRPQPPVPPVLPASDLHLAVLADLPLPADVPPATNDDTHEAIVSKVEDGSDSESGEPEAPNPIPSVCIKCERPLREQNAMQCRLCFIWLHRGCMSSGSNGKCAFCP